MDANNPSIDLLEVYETYRPVVPYVFFGLTAVFFSFVAVFGG